MKYIATTTITLLILVAILLPGSSIPDVNIIGIDKAAHLVLFFLWTLAVRYDFVLLKKSILFFIGIVFSVLTEILQLVAEDRSFDVYDMLADGVGLLTGLLLSSFVFRLLKIYR